MNLDLRKEMQHTELAMPTELISVCLSERLLSMIQPAESTTTSYRTRRGPTGIDLATAIFSVVLGSNSLHLQSNLPNTHPGCQCVLPLWCYAFVYSVSLLRHNLVFPPHSLKRAKAHSRLIKRSAVPLLREKLLRRENTDVAASHFPKEMFPFCFLPSHTVLHCLLWCDLRLLFFFFLNG